MLVNKELVSSELSGIKKLANRYLKKGDYNSLISCVKTAIKLNCLFSIQVYDDELERVINAVSRAFVKQSIPRTKKRVILFYDTVGVDNWLLTQQYINALISLDVEFVYVTSADLNRDTSSNIRKAIESSEHGRYIMFHADTVSAGIAKLLSIVESVQPEKALLQIGSVDMIGILTWQSLDYIEQFYINYADHLFWTGLNESAYVIEFREYGAKVTMQNRKINRERLYINRYYPIECKAFDDEISISENCVKICSAGQMYKTFGDNESFFHLIKDILIKYSNVIFYYIGSGPLGKNADLTPMSEFIMANNLGQRWKLLGNRKDLSNVLQRMDIYVGTLPISGGLTTLLAANASLPIISLNEGSIEFNELEEIFSAKRKLRHITFHDKSSFFKELDKLVYDDNYRAQVGNMNRSAVTTSGEFSENLGKILEKQASHPLCECSLDDKDYLSKISLERVNKYSKSDYYKVVISSKLYFVKPFHYVDCVLRSLLCKQVRDSIFTVIRRGKH